MVKKNYNKFIVLLLIFTMVFTLVGCKEDVELEESEEVSEKNDEESLSGIYEGTGTGRGGDLKVNVELEDGKINNIEVVDHSESAGFDKAMELLKDEMVEKNTPDVDSITGCTLTSNGFINAVKDAFEKANIDIASLEVKEDNEKTDKEEVEEDYDVVVVGAGGAGFAAAIEAKNNGANVVLLEKLPLVGGNTLLSGGEYAAPNNWIQEEDEEIEDSVELFAKDIMEGGDNIANKELVDVVAKNALDGAEWLRDEIGVEFEDELMFFGGHSVMRSLIPKGASGYEIIKKQKEKAEELDIPILTNTEATELITDDDGKITGVKAESKDKNYTFNTSKGVVLTTGGFGSNLEMRKEYNPDIDEDILSTNSVGSTGDGINMATKVGADLVGMEHIQTYPVCDPISGSLLYFGDSRLFGHAILVNKEGERFVEELERRDVISMAIKDQTDHAAYQLIDQVGLEESKLVENHEAEMNYLFENDLLIKADTLEEAAEFFGIDKENFKETVKKYNEYVEKGKDEEFDKRLLTNPIEKAPFYLMKAVPGVHHTMGGLKINTDAQVLDKDGKVIEGLYAAGEVTGGIHGTNRLGSNAIADIIVFGRIAGENIAK